MDPRLAALEPAEVKAVLAPFGEERTLPGAAYTSPEVFAWELDELWSRSWVAIGRVADFPERTATEVTVNGESLLVTNKGRLAASFNVCRHRGHEILGPGEQRTTSSLRCPYHGWVYDLDGRLRAAPKMSHRTDVNDIALVPVRLEVWRGWVFVAVDPAAPPLAEHIGDLDDQVAAYHPETLVAAAATSYEVAANWKFIHENYHECYHCPSIHPQLTAVTLTDSGVNHTATGAWVGGSLALRDGMETMSLDGRSHGCRIADLPESRWSEAHYFGLVPNLLISLHPDYAITHRLHASGPATTTIHCEWLFPENAVAAPEFEPTYAVEFWDVTNRQDWAACESLQRGAASRGHRPGVLGNGEDAVYQFLGMIASAYLGHGVRPIENPRRN